MARIEKVGINNIQQIDKIRPTNKKEIHKTFKNKLMEVEQEHIRDQLKIYTIR